MIGLYNPAAAENICANYVKPPSIRNVTVLLSRLGRVLSDFHQAPFISGFTGLAGFKVRSTTFFGCKAQICGTGLLGAFLVSMGLGSLS